MNKSEKKIQAVKEYLSGEGSMRSLGKKYGYGSSTIQRWVMKAKKESKKSEMLLAAKAASRTKEALPEDVKQLQEELRVTRIKLRLAEAMIDIADEQLGTEIRKKAGPRQS